jgi:hypothetical protein
LAPDAGFERARQHGVAIRGKAVMSEIRPNVD